MATDRNKRSVRPKKPTEKPTVPAPSPPSAPNVFTLDRIYDHNVVKIDGAEHALRNKDAIAILDFKWIEKNAPRIDEIFNLEEPTPEDADELSKLIERFTRILLDAPDSVHASLSDFQRMQVVNFFLQCSKPKPPKRTRRKANG